MKTLLWLSIVFATGIYIAGPIVDPDLWWHITVGRWILGHGAIPHTEHWNKFAFGNPWVAYSWLPEVMFAALDSTFSIRGLLISKLILAVFLALSLFYGYSKIAEDNFFGGLLGMYGTVACYQNFTLRPQTFVWVFFIWTLLISHRISKEGFTTKRGLLLALVMCLWANTHLTTAIGIFTIAAWIAAPSRIKDTGKAVLSGFLGTLITPNFGTEWLTFFHKTGHPLKFSVIAEFSPATVLMYPTGFVIVLCFLCLLLFHFKPRSAEPSRLFFATVLIGGGLAVVKFLPFSSLGLAAVIASMWAEARSHEDEPFGNFSEAIEKFRGLYTWLPKEGLSFVFMVTIVLNVMSVWRYPLGLSIVPADPMDFIIGESLPHPLMNPFGQGGYVMYRLSDEQGNLEHKVPIDGRTNVNPPEIWEQYYKALLGQEDWHLWLDTVQPQTILWKSERALTSLLLLHPDWCRVYQNGTKDQGYSIFITREELLKRKPEVASLACTKHRDEFFLKQIEADAEGGRD